MQASRLYGHGGRLKRIERHTFQQQVGNVYYLTGKYEQALSYYKKALNYSDNALILINVAKAMYKLGNYKNAKVYYLGAVKKKSSFKKKYAYLEMGSKETEIRASDRAKIDTMVEWDYD